MSEIQKIKGVVYGEYKGKPTISIPVSPKDGEGFPFTFGLSKAKAIIANIKDIEFFANGGGAAVDGEDPF